MDVSRDTPSPLALNHLPSFSQALGFISTSVPLNLTSILLLWEGVLLALVEEIAPLDGTSLFYLVLEANNISSFRIFYNGTSFWIKSNTRFHFRVHKLTSEWRLGFIYRVY